MTIALSPATPVVRSMYKNQLTQKPNPPKALFSIHDDFRTSGNAVSWTASASYVSLRIGARRFQPLVNPSLRKRRVIVRCATVEEIKAEKSLVEKVAKEKMEKAIENLRSNFNSISTGRASPNMLDKIEVEYYGTPVGLKSLAQVTTPDASSILVQPYDKSSLKMMEKAIVKANLGMTPNNDGEVLRMTVPQLTSERRKELTKVVSKQAEEGKIAIRNIRRDAIKTYEKLEKEKKLSEDNVKDLSVDIQKLTDEYIKKVDAVLKQKEKELMTV